MIVHARDASGRSTPTTASVHASPSAGECGVKDQVSRSGPSIPPRCALVGPTASGKTALAVALARDLTGVELVSVDAMAVYRGLDIGTAKPTAAERAGVVWHLVDLVEPSEEFSVARFQAAAEAAFEEIASRGHVALLVGGTGLYHRAVVDGLELPGRFPPLAAELEREARAPGGAEALYARLSALDPLAASRILPGNLRRIVRALEVCLGTGRPFSSFGPGLGSYDERDVACFGLRPERVELDARIATRLDEQLAVGFLDEVRALMAAGGLSRTARQALGYRELLDHLEGRTDLETARRLTVSRTRAFARRQESWFRRDPRITWLEGDATDAFDTLKLALVDLGARTRG